jgi:hypothetical protein
MLTETAIAAPSGALTKEQRESEQFKSSPGNYRLRLLPGNHFQLSNGCQFNVKFALPDGRWPVHLQVSVTLPVFNPAALAFNRIVPALPVVCTMA